MTHGSLFAGIGGFDLGFERAGFRTVWQVEVEPFCRAVLKSRFPKVERYGDVRKVGKRNLSRVDVITAGVPCQDVSVAGKRAGLQGERTGLFYEFARILQELRPTWFVFENVPGLLSSNKGRDFAEVLRVLMVECGYGVCWRVLDSQFFGVAQRRRRLFVVGCFGKPCPPEVLFESEGCTGDSPKGRKAGESIANSITGGTGRVGSRGADDGANLAHALANSGVSSGYRYDPNGEDYVVAATLNSGGNAGGFRTEPGEHIVIQDVRGCREKRQHGIGISEGEPSYTLGAVERHGVGFYRENTEERANTGDAGKSSLCTDESRIWWPDGQPTDTPANVSAPTDPNGVRDFAGLPEGLDSARYRALGNAVTIQVAEWIAINIMRRERF